MHTARLVSTVIMALILMGCPPPVSDNSASGGNNPDNSVSGDPDPEPKAIVLPRVSTSYDHSMILKKNGELWAFGQNKYGQLGNGNGGEGAMELTPAQVMTAANQPMIEIAQASAGGSHTMILKKNGDLWAVGYNRYGQLGDGSNQNKHFAIQVKQTNPEGGDPIPITNVLQVSAGNAHSMILKKNGELWAAGSNSEGELGDGSKQNKHFAIQVKQTNPEGGDPIPMTNVLQVSAGAGGNHSMIIKENGDLWAVGYNTEGQLGDGSKQNKHFAIQVKQTNPEGGDPIPMTNVLQVSAGREHSMILKNNGELWAVGNNLYGQLGDGTNGYNASKYIPVQVKTADGEPMTNVLQISAGFDHSMIIKENGDLWAVGQNNFGQLGDGTIGADKKNPVQVKQTNPAGGEPIPMTAVAYVSAGASHSMIVKRDGSLWAVGKNDVGQLGDGTGGSADAKQLISVEITVP